MNIDIPSKLTHAINGSSSLVGLTRTEWVIRAIEVAAGMRPTMDTYYHCRVCSQPTRFIPLEHQESRNGVEHLGVRGWWTCCAEKCHMYGRAP